MAATAPTPAYRKLTPMKRGLGTMSQLALASDHLLHITSTGYSETYRRFFLRDIQAMMVVHTARRVFYASAIVLLGLIVLMIVHSADGGAIGMSIVGAIALALLLWNHLRGAGCRVVIITAVQQESVGALCRLPRTRKILAELRPLVEAAQADLALSAATVPTSVATDADVGLSAPPIPPPLPPPLPS